MYDVSNGGQTYELTVCQNMVQNIKSILPGSYQSQTFIDNAAAYAQQAYGSVQLTNSHVCWGAYLYVRDQINYAISNANNNGQFIGFVTANLTADQEQELGYICNKANECHTDELRNGATGAMLGGLFGGFTGAMLVGGLSAYSSANPYDRETLLRSLHELFEAYVRFLEANNRRILMGDQTILPALGFQNY